MGDRAHLIVGAPVALRAWALPKWFEHLAAQTRRPDGFAFVHSGRPNDETWLACQAGAAKLRLPSGILPHGSVPHTRTDNERFRTLATLRNHLIELTCKMGGDLLLSLDTDVMLEDEHTIERLEQLVYAGNDTASPVLYLHPLAHQWAYNAGWWVPGGAPGDPQRAWARPNPDQIPWGDTVQVDVPMAATLMTRRVLQTCRYVWHESGEDLGFAQDLDRCHCRCAWDTALKARHVWSEDDL
jgi:hypothetical protein